MTKMTKKVPENRDQGIFLNGRVKKRIVAVFIRIRILHVEWQHRGAGEAKHRAVLIEKYNWGAIKEFSAHNPTC